MKALVVTLLFSTAWGLVCNIKDYGAAGDNKTDDTASIQRAIDDCHARSPHAATALFPSGTYRVTSSVVMTSNMTLSLDAHSTLFSDVTPQSAVFNKRCPTTYWKSTSPVICGQNLTNIAIVGANASVSVLDGGGSVWWNNGTFGTGPRMFEVTWTRNITLRDVSFVNSPSWTVHPTFCSDILAERIRIVNPRWTPNTDGFDPDSCTHVVLRDSFIDTGDDGISIKSANSSFDRHLMMPTRDVHIYRTTVLSRNVCVGSATFGGVHDIMVEDCVVGDEHGSSPWALKYKSHRYYPGPMTNHTYRRIKIGKIAPNTYQQPHGGTAIIVGLGYGDKPPSPLPACPPDCPLFDDVTFEDITIEGAVNAGDISGFPENKLHGITFRNISFKTPLKKTWSCKFVDSYKAEHVSPPLKCSKDA